MGLTISTLRFLTRIHKERVFEGPLLTLGRQQIYSTYDNLLKIINEEGLYLPENESSKENRRTNIPSWQGSRYSINTSDVAFFKLLGLEDINCLDISNYEDADIQDNLNRPVPLNLRDRFGVIIDGGTTEHIFDVRQCLMNINMMLRIGGRVIHMTPASNGIGHGFYSFNPELYFDYYMANGFSNIQAWILVHGKDPSRGKCKLYSYKYNSYSGRNQSFRSSNPVTTLFVAEKTNISTYDKIPIQGQFHTSKALTHAPSRSFLKPIKEKMPLAIYNIAILIFNAMKRLWRLIYLNKTNSIEYLGKI